MKLFYHCYGSTHSSVAAAAIHLGLLPSDRRPEVAEIMEVPFFDQVADAEIGTPLFMGRDHEGHEILAIGTRGKPQLVLSAVEEFLGLVLGTPPGDLVFRDTLHLANIWVRVGGFLSRRVGLVFPGRRLAALGIRQSYPGLVELVQRTQGELGYGKPWSEAGGRRRQGRGDPREVAARPRGGDLRRNGL